MGSSGIEGSILASRTGWTQYAIAVSAFLAATLLTWALRVEIYPAQSPIFLAAITLAAWVGGFGPGLLVAGLSGAALFGMTLLWEEADYSWVANVLWAGSFILVALLTCSLGAARKRAEEALRERDLRLRLVSEQLPAGLWSTDRELRLTSGFGAGFTMQQGVGESLYSYFKTKDPIFPPIAAHRAALAGESVSYESQWDGRTHQARVEPLRNAEGDIIGVVGVALDISERKAAEEALLDAKHLAEQAAAAREQFLAMLSHELRTPLTPALAAANALELRLDLSAEVKRDVDMIRRNIELEAALIDDLLDLTRIGRGKLTIRSDTVDAHALLSDVIEICEEEFTRTGVVVTVELRARAHHVLGDASRLRQVFWNLVKNGVKFTPVGGSLHIRSEDADEGMVRITVIDSGVGIEPDVLPRIFDAFEQGPKTVTRRYGGLGLGLAISKALVDAHGGRISAASEGSGRGATFTVDLNTTPAPVEPQPLPVKLAERGRERIVTARRLLLVEDHDDTRRVLTSLLSSLGHTVRAADSLGAALRFIEEEEFDLIISDLGLPDGSGVDLVRKVRELGTVKAIALSGYGMEADVQRCRDAGFALHLTKPVNFSVLREAIEELV
jgi:signal transduction histidine kinase/CheY-like chemotaxis protein